MTFEEILDQAIAMLQRRGRVSYRALQRQFQLDDAYLRISPLKSSRYCSSPWTKTTPCWSGWAAPAPQHLSHTLPPVRRPLIPRHSSPPHVPLRPASRRPLKQNAAN